MSFIVILLTMNTYHYKNQIGILTLNGNMWSDLFYFFYFV